MHPKGWNQFSLHPGHHEILQDNIQGITKPAIQKLARQGGVKWISIIGRPAAPQV
ncbi:hypothetical protein PCANC_25842 [Puccinia coronata f. sp. avenae]|uniref:Uncharacterized protein n=1 Tax=Puccinia coronata f. sp. avenae TaxID=200324 RepID=A0A2N5TPF1_9BASI|nr:hypothetical protein PCANC_25842 [Puccinia coronata f. sp. avenae]